MIATKMNTCAIRRMSTSYEHIVIKDFVWTPPSCNKLTRLSGPSLEVMSMSNARNTKIA